MFFGVKELYSRKKTMEEDVIKKALNEAYCLICNEYESVCNDSLREEYDRVICLLEEAIGKCKE